VLSVPSHLRSPQSDQSQMFSLVPSLKLFSLNKTREEIKTRDIMTLLSLYTLTVRHMPI